MLRSAEEKAVCEVDEWSRQCESFEQDGPLSLIAPTIATAHANLMARGRCEEARMLREDSMHALHVTSELQVAAAYLAEQQAQ